VPEDQVGFEHYAMMVEIVNEEDWYGNKVGTIVVEDVFSLNITKDELSSILINIGALLLLGHHELGMPSQLDILQGWRSYDPAFKDSNCLCKSSRDVSTFSTARSFKVFSSTLSRWAIEYWMPSGSLGATLSASS
jgi:hypothetical protein